MQHLAVLVYKTDGYGTNETVESLLKLPWHWFLAVSNRHNEVVKEVKKVRQEIQANARSNRRKGNRY